MTISPADDWTRRSSSMERAELRLGGQVGSPGAVGTVYKVEGQPYYYKEYFEPSRHAAKLHRLIEWRSELSSDQREFLDAHCAWPLVAVTADGETVGFLMRPAPDEFWADMLGETHTLELQHLIHSATAKDLGIGVPSRAQRLALVGDLAGIFAFFDRHEIVYGDVSEKNILWTTLGSPRVYLIDCDNARPADFTGAGAAKPRNDSWRDPDLAKDGFPQVSSDRYALAVFCYRVFYGVTASLDGEQTHVLLPDNVPHLPELEQLLTAGLGAPGLRPPASQWVAALDVVGDTGLEAAAAKGDGGDKDRGRPKDRDRPAEGAAQPARGRRPWRLWLSVAGSALAIAIAAVLVLPTRAFTASPGPLAHYLAIWQAGPVKITVPHYNAFVQQTGKASDRWAYVNARIYIQNRTTRALNLSSAPGSLVLVLDAGFGDVSREPIVAQQAVTGVPANLHLYAVGFKAGPWMVAGPGSKGRDAGWKAGPLQPGKAYTSPSAANNSAIYQIPPPTGVKHSDGAAIAPADLHILGIAWLDSKGHIIGFSPVSSWNGLNSIKDFLSG